MQKTFSTRLNRCAEACDMTAADLSRWFDRPYHTVSEWLNLGRQPKASATRKRKQAFNRLELLEVAMKQKRGLPVPVELSEQERTKYIRKLRNELENSGLLAKGSAG